LAAGLIAALLLWYLVPPAPEAQISQTLAKTRTQAVRLPGDGLYQAGLLTTPADWSQGPLPALILLHGWLSDGTPGAETMADVATDLASRGFIVLSLSLRGWPDTGGEDDCALRQPRDVALAAEWLAAQPRVDGARIAVLGLSQGGQVALLAGAVSPRLGAIVALAAPTDLGRWAVTSDEPGVAAYVRESCGGSRAELIARNPVDQAGHIRVPVLLVHGQADKRVPPEQSRRMAKALHRAGGNVDLLWVARAGHDLDLIYDGDRIGDWLLAHL
jgi:dipeptidyl aminopeptidase/acylaminoacyl peptidase